MILTRRDFLRTASGAAAAAALPLGCLTPQTPPLRRAHEVIPPFLHGIASGDPSPTGVILWTRLTPPPGSRTELPVRFEIARDASFSQILEAGELTTSEHSDYIVKLSARALAPDSFYYYRFNALGEASPIGRTRTLPVEHVERLRFAVASCANYPTGYFNAYASIAQRSDLDAVIHLGDYIYEHGRGDALPGRDVIPEHEIVELQDYRARYALYRSDPDLQELHRQHPMIAVWDDHESADNSWMGGARNHQPETEGDWKRRKAAAFRAYNEWMPLRPRPGAVSIERSKRWGDLATLMMIDTRLGGRDQQAPRNDDHATMADPARRLMSPKQWAWLGRELENSNEDGVAWRVLGQQVMMGQMTLPGGDANADAWDGYRASRERMLGHIQDKGISDLVVLSGDIHSSWAQDLARDPFSDSAYDPTTGRGSLGVEFVTPAISSSPLGASLQFSIAFANAERTRPHLRWSELKSRGYVILDLDHERAQAEWHFQDDVRVPGARERFARAFATERGKNHLVAVDGPSTPPAAPEPAPA